MCTAQHGDALCPAPMHAQRRMRVQAWTLRTRRKHRIVLVHDYASEWARCSKTACFLSSFLSHRNERQYSLPLKTTVCGSRANYAKNDTTADAIDRTRRSCSARPLLARFSGRTGAINSTPKRATAGASNSQLANGSWEHFHAVAEQERYRCSGSTQGQSRRRSTGKSPE